MFEIVRSLIVAAAIAHGVSVQQMDTIACHESGFNRYAMNGQYTGLYQLGYGMQRGFFARGYNDLFDPAQQSNYVAEVLARGGQSNWLQTIFQTPCR